MFTLLMQDTAPFLTIFTVMASFSMHQLFYINHLDQSHVQTYFALQLATLYFGSKFEKMISTGFRNAVVDNGQDEGEDK